MRSISSLLRRPLSLVIVILLFLPARCTGQVDQWPSQHDGFCKGADSPSDAETDAKTDTMQDPASLCVSRGKFARPAHTFMPMARSLAHFVPNTAHTCEKNSQPRTGGLVLGGDVEDAVGIDVKGHIDLRHATRRWRDARQLKLAEQVVVTRARALALVHLGTAYSFVVLLKLCLMYAPTRLQPHPEVTALQGGQGMQLGGNFARLLLAQQLQCPATYQKKSSN